VDIWHRLGRIFRISNLGTLIFFVLNISLIVYTFCNGEVTYIKVIFIVVCYLLSLAISLSPVGEHILAMLANAKRIKRDDIKIKIYPLLDILCEQVNNTGSFFIKKINVRIIHDSSVNAYALGRKTICITDGLLSLSDDEIMAILSHEIGHLVYSHTVLQLIIGGANFLITIFLLFLKLTCWLVTAVMSLFAIGTKKLSIGSVIALIGGIPTLAIWLWTKFCNIFLMWSMRQNEFVADRFSFQIGYGNILASILDRGICTYPQKGLIKALYASHPSNDDRIAKLQELGVCYSRF